MYVIWFIETLSDGTRDGWGVRSSSPSVSWVLLQENLILLYANNKSADRAVHLRSLISTFVIRSLKVP